MKIICALLLCFIHYYSFSQCIANAGNDTTVCPTNGNLLVLGGNPAASNGTPPYTYKWECSYKEPGTNRIFTASHFLNDTTLANPILAKNLWESGYNTFYLTVTDHHNICRDTVQIGIINSKWICTMDDKIAYINRGDSLKLYKSCYFMLDTMADTAVHYTWSPSAGLSDPTDVYTWARPDTSTLYTLTITNVHGCTLEDNFRVFVRNVGIEQASKTMFSLYPNPANHKEVSIQYYGNNMRLKLYDIWGRLLHTEILPDGQHSHLLMLPALPNGLYTAVLYNEDSYAARKLIIK
jgi:hypothetical protein